MVATNLICVNPKEIERVLPYAAPLLNRALEYSTTVTTERALKELREGTFLLWLSKSNRIEALAVTQILENGICEVVLCAGDDRQRWVHFIEHLENYARSEGCRTMRIAGRKGWLRVLSNYRQTRVIIEKELK